DHADVRRIAHPRFYDSWGGTCSDPTTRVVIATPPYHFPAGSLVWFPSVCHASISCILSTRILDRNSAQSVHEMRRPTSAREGRKRPQTSLLGPHISFERAELPRSSGPRGADHEHQGTRAARSRHCRDGASVA